MAKNLDWRVSAAYNLRGQPLLGPRHSSSSALQSFFRSLWTQADGALKRLILVACLLILLSSALAGLAPLLLKFLVDELHLAQLSTGHRVPYYLIGAYALAHWCARTVKELRTLFHGYIDQRIQRQVSSSLFKHVMALPLSFHLERRTGAINQILSNGLVGHRTLLHHLTLTMLPVVVEVVTMGMVLLLLEQDVFLVIILACVFLYSLAFRNSITPITTSSRAVAASHINGSAIMTDSLLNYESIKCFGAEVLVHNRFCAALRAIEDEWKRLLRRRMENGIVVATIFALALGAAVYVAVGEIQRGAMSIGEFVLVCAYFVQITQPLEALGLALRDVAEGIAFIGKMNTVLGQRSERDMDKATASIRTTRPNVVFEGVSYCYERGRYVLRDLNFTIAAGKTVGVVGKSGSGKSSLVRLLVRLIEPTKGAIYVGGAPLTCIPTTTIRAAVAVVPQEVGLFDDSIAYNIGFGKPNSTREEVVVAAKMANIHTFISELPHGYDTVVGERGVKLSGGEKQRVAIARALIRRPKILVLDEATSSLDSGTEGAILQGLAHVACATTTLIIAHRLATVVHADEIFVMHEGSVVEHGSHDQLLQLKGSYAGMWKAQEPTWPRQGTPGPNSLSP